MPGLLSHKIMTDKELSKLRRQDLLQLMVAQGREMQETGQQLAEITQQFTELEANYERLRKRLDQKDMQIHALRDQLEAERQERKIMLEESGSIAEAALRLNDIFNTAQRAADQYLYNIKRQQEKHLAESCAVREPRIKTRRWVLFLARRRGRIAGKAQGKNRRTLFLSRFRDKHQRISLRRGK